MNQDTVFNLASQAMSLALKIAGPLLLVALVIGLAGQRLPGRHPDPGAEPVADPEDRRRGRRDGRAGPVDARPARLLHGRAVHGDPVDGGLVNNCSGASPATSSSASSWCWRASRRCSYRAAVLLADHPAARARDHRRRHLDRADADRAARPARAERRAGARRARDRGHARRLRLRLLAGRAAGRGRIGRGRSSTSSRASPTAPDQPHERRQGAVMARFYSLVGTTIFLVIGGDAWTLRGLGRTFELVPLTSGPRLSSLVGGPCTCSPPCSPRRLRSPRRC